MLISKTCLHTVSRYETWIFVIYKSCFIGQNGSNITHIDILLYYIFEKPILIFIASE